MDDNGKNDEMVIYGKNDIKILSRDGKGWVSSRQIAHTFKKEHKNVLKAIQNLDCSKEFTELNFEPSEYIDSTGRKLIMYLITRDGFSFLAMGFTGKVASEFKEKYIEAFNHFESKAIKLNLIHNEIDTLLEKYNKIHEIALTTIAEVKTKVIKHETTLIDLDSRVCKIENVVEIRENLSNSTKRLHDRIIKVFYQEKCPICYEQDNEWQYDHWRSRRWGKPQNTWKICKVCHVKITSGKTPREQIKPAWENYQRVLNQTIKKQLTFWEN